MPHNCDFSGFLILISCSFHCDEERYLTHFQSFKFCWDEFHSAECVYMRRMYMLLLSGMFNIHLLGSFGKMLYMSAIFLLIFVPHVIPIVKSEILMSPTIIVLLSISPFSSTNICYKCLGTLMLHIHVKIQLL